MAHLAICTTTPSHSPCATISVLKACTAWSTRWYLQGSHALVSAGGGSPSAAVIMRTFRAGCPTSRACPTRRSPHRRRPAPPATSPPVRSRLGAGWAMVGPRSGVEVLAFARRGEDGRALRHKHGARRTCRVRRVLMTLATCSSDIASLLRPYVPSCTGKVVWRVTSLKRAERKRVASRDDVRPFDMVSANGEPCSSPSIDSM